MRHEPRTSTQYQLIMIDGNFRGNLQHIQLSPRRMRLRSQFPIRTRSIEGVRTDNTGSCYKIILLISMIIEKIGATNCSSVATQTLSSFNHRTMDATARTLPEKTMETVSNTTRPGKQAKRKRSVKQKAGNRSKEPEQPSDQGSATKSKDSSVQFEQQVSDQSSVTKPKDSSVKREQQMSDQGSGTKPKDSLVKLDQQPSKQQTVTIDSLTAGLHNKTLRVEITKKSGVNHWKNVSGSGKVFTAIAEDSTSDTQIVAFNDLADKYHLLFDIGKTYDISTFRCRTASDRNRKTKSPFEVLLSPDTQLSCQTTVRLPIPEKTYKDILTASSSQPNIWVNICGILTNTSPVHQLTSRATKVPISKQEITLVDEGNLPIKAVFWNDDIQKIASKPDFVVVFLNRVRTSVYNGVMNLNFSNVSDILYEINHPRTEELKKWWISMREKNAIDPAHEQPQIIRLNFSEAAVELHRRSERSDTAPLHFTNRVKILEATRANILYKSCPADNCMKKLVQLEENIWFCPKCRIKSEKFVWRLSLQLKLQDETNSIWATAFGEVSFFGNNSNSWLPRLSSDGD